MLGSIEKGGHVVEKTAGRAVVIDPDPLWQQAVMIVLERADVFVVATSSYLGRAACATEPA